MVQSGKCADACKNKFKQVTLHVDCDAWRSSWRAWRKAVGSGSCALSHSKIGNKLLKSKSRQQEN